MGWQDLQQNVSKWATENIRLVGVISIAVGALLVKYQILDVFKEAEALKPQITVSMKMIFITPWFLSIGGCLAFLGPKSRKLFPENLAGSLYGKENRKYLLIAFLLLMVPSLAFLAWVEVKLSSLGYQFLF